MRPSIHAFGWIVAVALGAAGCGGAVTEQVVGPGAVRCQIAVTAPPQTVPAAGSSLSLNVEAARDCTWTATTESAWVQVTPTSGQGSSAITVSVAANAETRPRSAALVINETSISINQEARPCQFDLDPDRARPGPEGGHAAVRVVTTDGCEWRASSQTEWVRVLTERGTGSGAVELDISRNDGPERSTTITVAGMSLSVIQDGSSAAPPATPVPPAVCTFAIDSERVSFRSIGGSGSVRVVTEPGCPWRATAQVPWLLPAQPDGNGPGTLSYAVAANTSTTSDRSGTLTIAGRTHTVNQQACPLALDPAVQTFGSPGGPAAVRVSTEPGCTWTASSSADWIAISRSNGSGPDALGYQVGVYASTAIDRSGSIVVAGRTHSVRQAAFRPEAVAREGTLSNVSGSCPNFTFTVGDRVFITDARTRFDTDCEKIRNGVRAFVRGELLPDGRVLAGQVDLDD